MHRPLRTTTCLLAAALLAGHLAVRAQSGLPDGGQGPAAVHTVARPSRAASAGVASAEQDPGRTLYQRWCESCHGPDGDGTGLGSRYVYPPPRNLLGGRYGLVTSANRIASRDDLYRVLRDGMPGTAMVPFDTLREDELQALVDEVCRLRQVGAAARYAADCAQAGEAPDEAERREYVQSRTTASEVLAVPAFSVPDAQAAGRGKRLFEIHACASCHGNRGVGAADVALEDDSGNALRPRDLVHEPFKGGHQPESVYRRIRLGFPNGPMPAHGGLSDRETAELVNYVTSLSQEPKRILTSHQLRRYVVRGLYLSEFGDQPDR